MDFDIGNILYVVITIVAIIASLLGKKKKPANKNAKPGFFENLEQVLNMGQENPEIRDLQPQEPDLLKEYDVDYEDNIEDGTTGSEIPTLEAEHGTMQADYSTYTMEQFQMEGEMATEPMELIHLEDEDDPDITDKPDYYEIIQDFDARTAIVYSAIINRIYY